MPTEELDSGEGGAAKSREEGNGAIRRKELLEEENQNEVAKFGKNSRLHLKTPTWSRDKRASA